MAAFKRGRKVELVRSCLRRRRRRRAVLGAVFAFVLIVGGIRLMIWYVDETLIPRWEEETVRDDLFDPAKSWEEARFLMEEARANEFRGRRELAEKNYVRALSLIRELRRRAPAFNREEVMRAEQFCRDKVRALK